MQLSPNQDGQFEESEAGTIASLSENLFIEYGLAGYSLSPEEVELALIADFKLYAGFKTTYTQNKGLVTTLDKTQMLSVMEWAIIEPVIRAHCEMIQANRVEATGSLGGERFGLSVSEANQLYTDAKREMEPKTFFEEPIFISF